MCIKILRLATEYRDAGISVIPLDIDGSKAPAKIVWDPFRQEFRKLRWNPYRARFATDAELAEWFLKPLGIGLVCGIISGGLEVMDFDDGSLFEPWRQQVTEIVERLPVVETPSGGWHVLYRCCEIGGDVKIAMDPSRKKETLIETRGEGGYIVAEGSLCATHATGLPYVQYSGPYLPSVPAITPHERRELWRAARTFDKRSAAEKQKLIAKYHQPSVGAKPAAGNPVVQGFNARASWDSILRPSGWNSHDGIHWTRPGKASGLSAKVVIADDGNEILTVFSGNAGPLSPSGSFKNINKFDAWALLAHNGDNRAAYYAAKSEVTA